MKLFEVKLSGHTTQKVLASSRGAAYRVALSAIRTLLDNPNHSPLSEYIREVPAEIGQTVQLVADFAN